MEKRKSHSTQNLGYSAQNLGLFYTKFRLFTIYKARHVAKGYRQVQGIDYDETFSPIAMLKFVRITLAIVAFYDSEIWQMYVKTAFLNGFLEEELYMMQRKVLSIQRELTKCASSIDPF